MASRNLLAAGSAAQDTKTSIRTTSRNSNASNSTTNIESDNPQPKKIPPIKAPVGLAKGPDLKNCRSKKLKWNAKSKVGSLENKAHKPGGGNRKVETQKLEWKTTSKVQSFQNVNHKPGGGKVKIFNESYADKSSSSHGKSNTSLTDGESDQSSVKAKNAHNAPVDHKMIKKGLNDLKI